MILYHFTKPENLSAILLDGLIASDGRRGLDDFNDVTGGLKVVWLTAEPTMEWSLERRRMLLRRGLLCGPRFRNLPDATVCLKMMMPTSDHRLKHWRSWLQKHPQPGIEPDDPMINAQHWFYRGNISPDRLSVFKTVPRGVTCWEVPEIHEAWRNGANIVVPPDMEADLLAGRAGPDDYVKAHTP